MKSVSIRERDILVGCLQALAMLGIDARRQNTGAFIGASGKLVRCGKKGDPDIAAIIPRGPHQGKRLEIECKRKGEYPTREQLHRIREIQAAGGIAMWVNDAQICLEILQRVLEGWHVEVDERMNVWIVSADEYEEPAPPCRKGDKS